MRKAVIIMRENGNAKIPAFHSGCERAGYKIYNSIALNTVGEGDIVLTWNRHGSLDATCAIAQRRGARIIVAENGYIGADHRGKQFYAMALGHHNGAGTWKVGSPDRFDTMNAPLRPWRAECRRILILPQRGIGEADVRMPSRWAETISLEIRAQTKRPVIIRRHPGRLHIPLEPDLFDVHCAITWASGAGVKALAHGIPVFYDFPKWIAGSAARPRHVGKRKIANLEEPFLGDRRPMFERLAWAQFSLAEIESGYAVTWLTS